MSFLQMSSFHQCIISNQENVLRSKDALWLTVKDNTLSLRLETPKTGRSNIELTPEQTVELIEWLQNRLKGMKPVQVALPLNPTATE